LKKAKSFDALYIIKSEVAASRSEDWAIAQVKNCAFGAK